MTAAEEIRRRQAIFARSGAFSEPPEGLIVRRAVTADDLLAAYHLVHQCYVRRAYIRPDPSGLRIRLHSALPHCAIFLAQAPDGLAGTISVIPDSPFRLPIESCYGPEIAELRHAGRRIVEVSDLSIREDYRHLGLLTEFSRVTISYALHIGAEEIAIAVSPNHWGYFGTMLQFEPLDGERPYQPDSADRVIGLHLSTLFLREKYSAIDSQLGEDAFLVRFFFDQCPYVRLHEPWRIEAEAMMRDPRAFRRVFLDHGGLAQRCNQAEWERLTVLYPWLPWRG